MMSDGGVVDGSWQLNITVTDFDVVRTLRVKGDLHIGGVMLQLVEALGKSCLYNFYNVCSMFVIYVGTCDQLNEVLSLQSYDGFQTA